MKISDVRSEDDYELSRYVIQYEEINPMEFLYINYGKYRINICTNCKLKKNIIENWFDNEQ